MEIITGKMKHIIFHNDETNYYVLTVVAGDEVFTATGSFHGMKSPPPCGDITPMEVVSNNRAEPQN